MKPIGTYSAEEGSSVFEVPVGKQYTDVLISLSMNLEKTGAGRLYFDGVCVGAQTTGTYYAAGANRRQLMIHDFGKMANAIMISESVTNGIQVSNPQFINALYTKGMPDTVKFLLRESDENTIVSGTAKVYAR